MVSLIIVVFKMTSIPQTPYVSNSYLYPRFEPLVAWLSTRMPDVLGHVQWLEQAVVSKQ